MNVNRNYRDRLKWRALVIFLTFLPVLGMLLLLAWFILSEEGVSLLLALMFVGLAYAVGYGMASFKNDNADGMLARAGDKELLNWKTLIDMELEYREEKE